MKVVTVRMSEDERDYIVEQLMKRLMQEVEKKGPSEALDIKDVIETLQKEDN